MDETTRTSGRHSTDAPRGTAYYLIRQATGADWVEPSRHHHAEPESFAGDLSSDTSSAVA